MAEEIIDTGIVDKAIVYAVMQHSNTPRKGTKIPYIVHPAEAAAIVAGMTDDQELIAAAALHDTQEDTVTDNKELVKQFGERIARLVAAESEDKQKEREPGESWEDRKRATVEKLYEDGEEELMLALADKLSNIRAIQRDYEKLGCELWKRFNQKDPKKHAWYYGSIAWILLNRSTLQDTQACREYVERVTAVFGTECIRDFR